MAQDADKLWIGLHFALKTVIGSSKNQVVRLGMALEIGQKVKVTRLRDLVPKEVVGRLGKSGIIRQFKMVDGSGVGVVVEFDDNYSTWFFEDELSPE